MYKKLLTLLTLVVITSVFYSSSLANQPDLPAPNNDELYLMAAVISTSMSDEPASSGGNILQKRIRIVNLGKLSIGKAWITLLPFRLMVKHCSMSRTDPVA